MSAVSNRIYELDALRGFAAMGVLGLHSFPIFFWAWSCVDLFFILSGFLITCILLDNASSPRMLVAFYARRALRIWPVYFASLAVALMLYVAVGLLGEGAWPALPSGQWLTFFFMQNVEQYLSNVGELDYIWYFEHSWSLAVEEQFYFIWPAVFFLMRPGKPLLLLIIIIGLTLTAVARYQGMFFFLMATRIDGLLFGMAIAYLTLDRGSLIYRMPAKYFVLAAIIGMAIITPYLLSGGTSTLIGATAQRTLEVTGFCLIYAVLVVTVVRYSGANFLRVLRYEPFVYVGRISFALYMFQGPAFYLLSIGSDHGFYSQSAQRLMFWILTFILAHLSYVVVERRVLALKKYFPYNPVSSSEPSVSAPERAT